MRAADHVAASAFDDATKTPAGEAYFAVEGANGELGF